jgi:DNA-binding NtrC family response regulator
MSNHNTEVSHAEKEPLLPLPEARDLLYIVYLINALLKSGGNLSRAAEELEIGRRTTYELMEKYGISCAEGTLSIELTPLLHHVELRVPCLEIYLTQDQ